jgi:hypothetical protein
MSEEPKLEELDRLISRGKQKGYLTYDEVNDALPSDIVSLDQLDDIMMMFNTMDIEVVDSAKAARLPSEEVRERPVPVEDTTTTPRSRSISRPARWVAPRTPCACTCARWAACRSSPRRRDRPRQADRGGQEPGHVGHSLHEPRRRALPRAARPPPQERDLREGGRRLSTRRSSRRRRSSPSPGSSSTPLARWTASCANAISSSSR